MLQYVVGPAAEHALNISVPDGRSQTENCPNTQPLLTSRNQAAADVTMAVSYPDVRPEASGVTTGNKSTDHSAEPEVISPRTSSAENRDVMQPTVVVDLLPVAQAQKLVVPKKRGRKPKRRRRLAAASAGSRPPTSSEDLSANADVNARPEATTSTASQPSFDNCSSFQKDVAPEAVAPDEPRPAPKKRGRKPKKRPEPETAVVADVVESGRPQSAKSPDRSGGPAVAPVTTEVTTATLTASADNDSSTTLSTSGGNGNSAADSAANSRMPRRRGRKRKNTASDRDDQRQGKACVDEGGVQSVWKVTSPTTSEYSRNGVPPIKVTNVRLSNGSTKTWSGESSDAGDRDKGTAVTTAVSQTAGVGGRQGALKAKSWQPIVRRTAVPVLERAREWINAIPKPSRDDWTGPVFPAREVIGVESQSGSTPDSQTARDLPCLVPTKSPAKSRGDAELHAGSPSWRSSAANDSAGRLVMLPGVVRGPRPPAAAVAVDAASQLMYVIGRDDARGSPTVATSRSHSPQYGLPVSSVAGRRVVCSFDNNSRTGQYTTKRVCRLSRQAAIRCLSYEFVGVVSMIL